MRSWVMILPLLAAGCVSAPVTVAPPQRADAVCDGLRAAVDAHAEALVADGGDRSVVTGQRLIARYDAACTKGNGPR
jgi:hypothetical protein